ncbi:MAG: hypothetical protein RL768_1493 [Nitrospirota bacterium]
MLHSMPALQPLQQQEQRPDQLHQLELKRQQAQMPVQQAKKIPSELPSEQAEPVAQMVDDHTPRPPHPTQATLNKISTALT